jgi:tRNA A37 N6-isopentenylltransferase MiaA
MNTFTITLTDAELKALAFVAYDPQEWMDNAIHERCRLAMEQIFMAEVARMVADPTTTSIPADREQVVLDADILSSRERADADISSLAD